MPRESARDADARRRGASGRRGTLSTQMHASLLREPRAPVISDILFRMGKQRDENWPSGSAVSLGGHPTRGPPFLQRLHLRLEPRVLDVVMASRPISHSPARTSDSKWTDFRPWGMARAGTTDLGEARSGFFHSC